MKLNKEQDFDEYANDYRNIMKDNLKVFSEFGSEYFCEYKIQIIKKILKKSPKNILDFGCGDGIGCEYLRKYFPESAITGVDVSLESLKVAENKQILNTSFRHYDGVELPLEANSFDLVFVAGVFHHIEEQKHSFIIREINRVLKNNGKLFVFEHNPLNPFTQMTVKDCIFDKGVKLIRPRGIKKDIKKASFKEVKINYTLFFPRYRFFQRLFLLEDYMRGCAFGAQYYIEATK